MPNRTGLVPGLVTLLLLSLVAGCPSGGERIIREGPVRTAVEQDYEYMVVLEEGPSRIGAQESHEYHRIDELLEDAASTPGEYRLVPNDVIEIRVFDNPDLTLTTRVPQTGPLFYPHVGEVLLQGRTLQSVSEEIRVGLEREYLREAHVSIYLKEFAARGVSVLGRVARRGTIELEGDQALTLLQAIGFAGGFEPEADVENIQLIRTRWTGGVPENRRYRLSYNDIVMRGRLEFDLRLLPGDKLIVPTLRRFFVIGEVFRPGSFPFEPDAQLTLSKALGIAGGVTDKADLTHIELIRDDGELFRRLLLRMDLGRLHHDSEDMLLAPNDTIIVHEQDLVYVLGSVNNPNGFDYNSELTVAKAIALAGGFTRVASPNSTYIVRVGDGGIQENIRVRVQDIINEGEAEDPRLLPGDIIFVPESFF